MQRIEKQAAGSSFASAAAQLGSTSSATAIAAKIDDDEECGGEEQETVDEVVEPVKNEPGGNFMPKKWKKNGNRLERKFNIPLVRRDATTGKIISNKGGRRRRLPGN